MQHIDALPFLREALLFLALAGVLIPLLQRLHINQVLGFLAAVPIFILPGFPEPAAAQVIQQERQKRICAMQDERVAG